MSPGTWSNKPGLKCMVAAAKSSTDAGCSLGRWLASPAALLLQLCPVPGTESVPMSWSHRDRVLPHKSWAAEPLLQAHLGWIHPCHGLTAPGRSQPLSQSTANATMHPCSVTQVLQLVLTCCEGALRLGIIYSRHTVLDSRGSALHLCRL